LVHIRYATGVADQETGEQGAPAFQRAEMIDHTFAEGIADAKEWRSGVVEQLESVNSDHAPMWLAPDLAGSAHDAPNDQDPLSSRPNGSFGKIDEHWPVPVVDEAIRPVPALDDIPAEHTG
jgi:hypothetical protein